MHRPSRSRCKQARGGCPGPAPVTGRIRRELGLDGGPGLGLDQRVVLSRMKVALMRYPAEVDGVGQDPVEVASRDRPAAPYASGARLTSLGGPAAAIDCFLELSNATQFQVQSKDPAYRFGLGWIDDQLALADVVAERRIAAHPPAFLLRGGDLVADTLAGDLALALGAG